MDDTARAQTSELEGHVRRTKGNGFQAGKKLSDKKEKDWTKFLSIKI
jgi:hypothetical protein